MALKIDFLVKEIYVKIATKLLAVFRTLYLLYFFSISSQLDDFYFAKSIVGVVILINILFEITYSSQINLFKNNHTFVKKVNLLLNKFTCIVSFLVITFSFFFFKKSEIFVHIIILCIWGFININSNFFLLLNRYKNHNKKVLIYYLSVAFLDIFLLILMLNYFNENEVFKSISLSILTSEIIVFLALFFNQMRKSFKFGNDLTFVFDVENKILFKVLIILIVIALIDISDKYFLSLFGEGQITYYTYGLYAPLMIRQSLDIRTNFFVQINKSDNLNQTKQIFYNTLKKLVPFFLLGVFILLLCLELFEQTIKTEFKIQDFNILKKIVYLGVFIAPLYMIWDLFYRFYYREKKINLLLKLVILGLIFNISLNYILGIQFSLGIFGVLISTLLVFLFYNLVSFNQFFKKSK